jgi:sulfur-oxidizing protein SoxX
MAGAARPGSLAALAMAGLAALPAAGGGALAQAPEIVGDAVPRSLTGRPGDAARGRAIVLGPTRGNCTICHVVPAADERFHGDLAPSLRGVADRLTLGQLRLRMVDSRRVNPETIMPAYFRVEGFRRVAAAFAGRPVMTAEEIEDVVAYLATLKE